MCKSDGLSVTTRSLPEQALQPKDTPAGRLTGACRPGRTNIFGLPATMMPLDSKTTQAAMHPLPVRPPVTQRKAQESVPWRRIDAESVRPAVLRSQMGASTYQPNQCLGGVVLPGWQWVCSPRHWSRSTAAAGAGTTAALAGVYQAAAVSPSVNRWAAVVEARRPVVRFISVTRWERG